jgi:hypothetical protein
MIHIKVGLDGGPKGTNLQFRQSEKKGDAAPAIELFWLFI